MPDTTPDRGPEIKESDIVFDCPYCNKSLAIDYKGAGLTIPCTDCGKSVQVPIPDGMELSDLDSSNEERDVRLSNLRKSMTQAQARIKELEAELDEISSRRDSLEKNRTDSMYKFAAILEKTGVIQKAIKDINKALNDISDTAQESK